MPAGKPSEAGLVEWKLVLADIESAVKLEPENAAIYYNRGCVNFEMKEYGKAIEDFTKAIALDSHMAEAYYNRALVYLSMEQKEKALPDLSKAGELGIYDAYSIIKQNSK